MFTDAQYRILKWISPGSPESTGQENLTGKSKLSVLMGEDFFQKIQGKVVIDFGCGEGAEAVEIAERGAKLVIGIDIREQVLELARIRAASKGLQNKCVFATSTNELADLVISVDAFEHFEDPAKILSLMNSLLQPKGEILVSFGPTWYHPLGGHLFSVFPWAHLIFSEEALIRWRSSFKSDGATRFGEVAGGLNQMTIANFEKIVNSSVLKVSNLELVPIKKLQSIHNSLTREFTTAVVRCRLIKRTTV